MERIIEEFASLWRRCADPAAMAERQRLLSNGVFIYGAGGYGRRILSALETRGLDCVGFIDRRANDPGFRQSLKCAVYHPDEFPRQEAKGRSLIIGVMNTSASLAEPRLWANRHDFVQTIQPGLLPEIFGAALDSYWMTRRSVTASHLQEIDSTIRLLADSESKNVLSDLVSFRLTADESYHPLVDVENQYIPKDVPMDVKTMSLVDGGAFTGDTYENMVSLGANIVDWFAFEPDLTNFAKLVRSKLLETTKATFFPCGLGDQTCDLSFADGEGAGSHLSDVTTSVGATQVRVISLDDALAGVRPTYIKLDIEGFEAEAIAGMKKTIRENNPFLAVCIYHKPSDLWTLPHIVHDLVPESRLYIRQHGHNGFDTVLYAVP